jgi:spermidine synthase
MQIALLYTFAFLSGSAALVYQVAWSKALSLTFGSSTLAISAVVAGFMGGMGIGAWLYHRVKSRGGSPLRGYGLLELGIAFTTAALTRTIHEAPAKCTLNADLSSAATRSPHAGAPIT